MSAIKPVSHVKATTYGSINIKPRAMTSLAEALARVPDSVGYDYVFKPGPSDKYLIIDPRSMPMRAGFRAKRGLVATDTIAGGKRLALDQDRFAKAQWIRASLFELLRDKQLTDLQAVESHAGFADLTVERDFLVVMGARKDAHPIVLGFSSDPSSPALVEICKEVHLMPMKGQGGGMIVMRKPVIYVYPDKKQIVSVAVSIDGPFVAQYPKMHEGAWRMVATPDGTLFDPTSEKRYSYLFWEGLSGSQFRIDPAQAFCIEGSAVESFLEQAAQRFALTDKERTDFVTYWLPAMAQNPYNLVQFVERAEYDKHARMTIEPKPDAVIRMFMIFEAAQQPSSVGAPELPQQRRGKFTVVEWGGANLDECR